MPAPTRADLDALFTEDATSRNAAFAKVIEATDQPVEWAYEIWDQAVEGLSAKDNHVRAVSAQLLCNLAKSDPDYRMRRDFDRLLQVTRDPRFVTARHALQNIWKVALAGPEHVALLMSGLRTRYTESFSEKNGTLVRFDILVDMANLYDKLGDEAIKSAALAWIDEEPDPKYRKKYLGVWKKK